MPGSMYNYMYFYVLLPTRTLQQCMIIFNRKHIDSIVTRLSTSTHLILDNHTYIWIWICNKEAQAQPLWPTKKGVWLKKSRALTHAINSFLQPQNPLFYNHGSATESYTNKATQLSPDVADLTSTPTLLQS